MARQLQIPGACADRTRRMYLSLSSTVAPPRGRFAPWGRMRWSRSPVQPPRQVLRLVEEVAEEVRHAAARWTGTGKDFIAATIHHRSREARVPKLSSPAPQRVARERFFGRGAAPCAAGLLPGRRLAEQPKVRCSSDRIEISTDCNEASCTFCREQKNEHSAARERRKFDVQIVSQRTVTWKR